ncbi:RDD family protein [Nonomuraea sp. LP-02]|uniref:RDD family protein n=1 Tax=Nonomuraea sp. LP-02 TaxID=3097960 RepID=UPI002E341C9B|nr:RDD family protein [Nonomuraea sp. LP-02]MED7927310.1 RDD family protein [Nonomuraea sp. LP-02]
MSEVVTGDAVVVEVRVAQMPSRALAIVIDLAVQVTVLIGAYVLLGAFATVSDPAAFAAVMVALMVLVMVGYPVIFESVSRGRSLGKLALGLRVVSDDGSPERFRQALFRGLAGVVEFWMLSGAPALISSLVSQRGKRLGDIFAGTIVISDRAPRQSGQAFQMPPPLAAWAATLELSRLPDEVAQAARQYLLRWHDLSPQVQHEMGMRIAAQTAAFVSPAAPAGVPPYAYLSAVLAERRRREEARLALRAGAAAGPQPPRPSYPPPPQPSHAPSPSYAPPPQPTYAPPPQPSYAPPPPPPPGPGAGVTPGGFAPPQ